MGEEDVENNPRRSNEDPSLWRALGLSERHASIAKSPDSSDSSLDFESSFFQYRDSKRGADFSVSCIEQAEECNLSTFLASELKDCRHSEVSVRCSKGDIV